jgi:hypothetical protein
LWAAILAFREAFRPVLSKGSTKGVYSRTATFRQTLTVDIVQVLSMCVMHTSFSTSVQDFASIVVQSGVEVHRFSQSIVHLGTEMVLHLSSKTNEHLEKIREIKINKNSRKNIEPKAGVFYNVKNGSSFITSKSLSEILSNQNKHF